MKELVIQLEKIIDGKKYEIKIQFQKNNISIFDLIMKEINEKKRKELEDARNTNNDEIGRTLL